MGDEAYIKQELNTKNGGQSQSSIRTIIDRLNLFIEDETQAMNVNSTFDYRTSSERKNRLLYELMRASRLTDFGILDKNTVSALSRLKSALEVNSASISANLSAVRDVANIMVNIMRNEEADGTYDEMI